MEVWHIESILEPLVSEFDFCNIFNKKGFDLLPQIHEGNLNYKSIVAEFIDFSYANDSLTSKYAVEEYKKKILGYPIDWIKALMYDHAKLINNIRS